MNNEHIIGKPISFGSLYLALGVVACFYAAIHFFVLPPLIHQETGLCLLAALVKNGHGLANGDPWWSAPPDTFNFLPPLRLWLLYNFNRLISNPHHLAAIGSVIYALLAVSTWWYFGLRLNISPRFIALFSLFATLPWNYDLWTVGLSQGYKDITFLVIFTPLIFGKLNDALKTNNIKDIILLSMITSIYFFAHPTQAILVLQIPFVVLLFCSERRYIARNLSIYLVFLFVICLPYLLLLASGPLAKSIQYDKFVEILNYRFQYVFPNSMYLHQLPFIGTRVDIVISNWIYILIGILFFPLYIYLTRNIRIAKFDKIGLLFCVISCLFMGYYRLTLLAVTGWSLALKKSDNLSLRWFIFLPLLLMTLSYSMMAFWALAGKFFGKHLLDTQYLLYLLVIPYIIVGCWYLIQFLAESFQKYLDQVIWAISLSIGMFLWYWNTLSNNVSFFCEILIVTILYNFSFSRLKSHKINNMLLFLKKIKIHYLFLLILSLIIYFSWPAGKYVLTPFHTQKHIVNATFGLTKAIMANVPENEKILTGPYFIRFMTKRYTYWTKKDFNIYSSGRYWEKCLEWYEDALRIDRFIKDEEYGDLYKFMNDKNCKYIILPNKINDNRFNLIYHNSYYLYRVNM